MQEAVVYYLEEALLPHIEKRGGKSPTHESGWSLAYHGISRVGKLVRVSKYEDAGPFALSLVTRAVEIIRNRYPVEAINGIVSVPRPGAVCWSRALRGRLPPVLAPAGV
jgi:hypothetical protein